jgi:endonuclease YncB( thermonuclease family)
VPVNRGVAALAVVAVTALAGLLAPATSAAPADAQTIQSRIDVIDGDTIRVRTLESTRRRTYLVALIGIDAPETNRDGSMVECGGPEATHSALTLSFSGPRDGSRDCTKHGPFARPAQHADPELARLRQSRRQPAARLIAGLLGHPGWPFSSGE